MGVTDGGVERIAAHPDLLAVALLPVSRGHQARTFVGQVHPGGAAEAALLGKGRDLVDAQALGHDVIVHVAGVDERLLQRLAAVTAAPPAAEDLVAQLGLAAAEDGLAGIHAVLEEEHGHEQLPD